MAGIFSSLGFKSTSDFSDSINQLLQDHGFGQETLKMFTIAQELPTMWYAVLIGIFYAFLIRPHLFILTDKHLIVADLDAFKNFQAFTSYSFQELKILKISKGLMDFGATKITIGFPDNKARVFTIPWPKGGTQKAEEIATSISGTTIEQLQEELKRNPPVIPSTETKTLKIIFAVVVLIPILLIVFAIILSAINRVNTLRQRESLQQTKIENSTAQQSSLSRQNSVVNQVPPATTQAVASKYLQDSDGDSIPDFVEKATSYDPLKDECLLASCGQSSQTIANQQVNVLFILDSSGSMAEMAGREVKMTAAKNALKNLAASLPSNVNIGLMVYGYKGSNSAADKQISCQGIDMFYPLAPVNMTTFNQAVDSFSPTGWTPIGGAFRKAKDVMSGKTGQKNIVVLVTDGVETCDSDPSSAIKDLRSLNIQPVVNIIGFGVNQTDSSNLQQLSQLGGGQYFLASDSDKLAEVFANFKKALETLQCNQNNSQAYISCVAKRADAANAYLTKLNQSLYLNGQSYQGVRSGSDDNHDVIFNTQTKISQYKNQAGETFSNILQQNSLFLGQQYRVGP